MIQNKLIKLSKSVETKTKQKKMLRNRKVSSSHLQLFSHMEGQLTMTNPSTTPSNPLKTTFIQLLKMMCKHVYFKKTV